MRLRFEPLVGPAARAGMLCLLCTATAVAQERDYDSLIAEGLQEFELQHWEEAQSLLERAHARRPGARTLRGLGMVAFELRHYVESERLLLQALEETREALDAKQRANVEALVVRAQTFIGELRVQLRPSNASLSIDDRPVSLGAGGRLRLVTGEHRLVASAPGHREANRVVGVRSGQAPTVTLELQPVAGTAAAGAPAAALQADGGTGDDDGLLTQWWFWTAAGAVVAGAVLTALAVTADDDVRPAQPGDVGGVVQALDVSL